MRRFALFATLAILGFSTFAQEKVTTRVSFTSQPSGASVIVDGRDRGTTPLTLFDLKKGRHHLRYRLNGYEDEDAFFSTDEGAFIERTATLAETKGLLLLTSEPAGAHIAIDDVSVGETPRLVTHLPAQGLYAIKLTKAGYLPQTLSVKFNGREPVVRHEKLVRDAGVINITSEPAGAEVTVNGIVRGKTPLVAGDIPKGRAVVTFKLAGYRDEVRELTMRPGDSLTLPIVLSPLPGTLHLESVPAGARFYVNSESRGVGPLTIAGLAAGAYEVRAEMPGYGTLTRTITLENGGSAREEFRLANQMGRLEVRTNPIGATLVFDGKVLGETKGSGNAEISDVFPIESILEGDHVLVIRKEGYAESTRHPKIKSCKTSQANVKLKRIFKPNIEITTDRGSYRGVLVSNTPESVVVEVSLGITRAFPRSEIRSMKFIGEIAP